MENLHVVLIPVNPSIYSTIYILKSYAERDSTAYPLGKIVKSFVIVILYTGFTEANKVQIKIAESKYECAACSFRQAGPVSSGKCLDIQEPNPRPPPLKQDVCQSLPVNTQDHL